MIYSLAPAALGTISFGIAVYEHWARGRSADGFLGSIIVYLVLFVGVTLLGLSRKSVERGAVSQLWVFAFTAVAFPVAIWYQFKGIELRDPIFPPLYQAIFLFIFLTIPILFATIFIIKNMKSRTKMEISKREAWWIWTKTLRIDENLLGMSAFDGTAYVSGFNFDADARRCTGVVSRKIPNSLNPFPPGEVPDMFWGYQFAGGESMERGILQASVVAANKLLFVVDAHDRCARRMS